MWAELSDSRQASNEENIVKNHLETLNMKMSDFYKLIRIITKDTVVDTAAWHLSQSVTEGLTRPNGKRKSSFCTQRQPAGFSSGFINDKMWQLRH